MSNIANDILLVIVAGLAGGIIANFFRQPLMIGYLVAGMVINSPWCPFHVSSSHNIQMLADIGVALMLFALGLEFPLKTLKTIKNIALWGTLIQVTLTFILCGLVGYYFTGKMTPALWIAAALISSSTAVILKILENRHLEKTLSGRVMLGMSIVQDLTVIPVMIVLVNWRGTSSFLEISRPVLLAAVFVGVMWFIGSKLCAWLMSGIARYESRELFLMLMLTLGLGIGYLTQFAGLSYAFGAFVAGMVISESDFSQRAISELIPLRDIFGLLFFVSVGMLLDLGFLAHNYHLVIMATLLFTLIRGVILMGIGYAFGYRRIIPLALLLGMIPISEIAFVLIQSGKSAGILHEYMYYFILSMTIFSMLIGPFFAGMTSWIYRVYNRNRHKQCEVEVANLGHAPAQAATDNPPVIIAGESYIETLGQVLRENKLNYVIITSVYRDFSRFKKSHLPVIYGSPTQSNVLQSANISEAKLMIIANTHFDETLRIAAVARKLNQNLRFIAQADSQQSAALLRQAKIDQVVLPQQEAELEMLHQALHQISEDHEYVESILSEQRTRYSS